MLVMIPLPVMIPAMIVRNPAALSFPIALEKTFAIMMRRNPMRARIGCPSPISRMPFVVVSYRVPVARDP